MSHLIRQHVGLDSQDTLQVDEHLSQAGVVCVEVEGAILCGNVVNECLEHLICQCLVIGLAPARAHQT